MEVEARAPLTVALGSARGARIFCALSAQRVVRLLAHRSIITEDADGDPLRAAALRALPPPAGHALTRAAGDAGPGMAEADALAALAALNVASARIRSPIELALAAARLARLARAPLDEDRLLAAALGGLVLIRPGLDRPEAERLRPPRRARLLWRPGGATAWLRVEAPPPGCLWGPGDGLAVRVTAAAPP